MLGKRLFLSSAPHLGDNAASVILLSICATTSDLFLGVAMDTEPYPVVAGLLIRKAVTW